MRIPYNRTFYENLSAGTASSAERVVPHLMCLVKPRSVVDVGCGTGSWAAEFKRQGVMLILGIDGAYVDKSQLRIPAESFIERDLEMPLALEQSFDLAICLEVAEHLSPSRAPSFVRDLTKLAPIVVFSAAIPFQGGTHHVNEQRLTYWSALFEGLGFQAIDCLRLQFWNDQRVDFWYRQNMMIFASEARMQQFAHCNSVMPLDVVHPEVFQETVTRPPTLGFLLTNLPGAVKRFLKSRVFGSITSRR